MIGEGIFCELLQWHAGQQKRAPSAFRWSIQRRICFGIPVRANLIPCLLLSVLFITGLIFSLG